MRPILVLWQYDPRPLNRLDAVGGIRLNHALLPRFDGQLSYSGWPVSQS